MMHGNTKIKFAKDSSQPILQVYEMIVNSLIIHIQITHTNVLHDMSEGL